MKSNTDVIIDRLRGFGVDTDLAMSLIIDDPVLYITSLDAFIVDDGFERINKSVYVHNCLNTAAAAEKLHDAADRLKIEPMIKILYELYAAAKNNEPEKCEKLCETLNTVRRRFITALTGE